MDSCHGVMDKDDDQSLYFYDMDKILTLQGLRSRRTGDVHTLQDKHRNELDNMRIRHRDTMGALQDKNILDENKLRDDNRDRDLQYQRTNRKKENTLRKKNRHDEYALLQRNMACEKELQWQKKKHQDDTSFLKFCDLPAFTLNEAR